MLLPPKYNSGSQTVGRVVDRHPGKVCKDLTRYEVCLSVLRIEQRLRCQNVVVAILCDLVPKALRHRLVSGQAKLLMVDAQLDLELLQALFLR